jgi:glucose-1-phosphate thymidylyltransferase
MDMVDLDEQGRVRSMIIQPPQTQLHYGWICAVWTPVFTCFMHEHLAAIPTATPHDGASGHESARLELSVGAVIQAAVQERLRVEGVPFPGGTYLDIGTPGDLVKASRAEGVIPAVDTSHIRK